MPEEANPAGAGKTFANPLSGERIILPAGPGPAGSALVWDLVLAPGGRVPASHAHPRQEERFAVREGRVRFRVGWRRLLAGPGQTVRVPPGTVHHFANAGPGPARVTVTTVPALAMPELLETAAAMARDQQAAGRAAPRLIDLALFMRDFEPEVRAPYLPRALVHAVIGPLAWLAGRCGLDRRYRELRAARGGTATSADHAIPAVSGRTG